jgi:rSAM/selenodomain-associated transferase 1
MVMSRMKVEPVSIALLAKAPIPGFAKTRLIPALGAHGAATLQELLTEQAVAMAVAAETGLVTLWAAPDCKHPTLLELTRRFPVALQEQPEGDLGARMLAAIEAAEGPVLVIGTDCPHLVPSHLRDAAQALRAGSDVAIIPADDGGYVLIGLRRPQPDLFTGMTWSHDQVMARTRERIAQRKLSLREFSSLPDIDEPEDLPLLNAHEALKAFA